MLFRSQASESSALEILEVHCSKVEPFEITLGDVETFTPITPTIFIRVERAAYRMRELHDRLNTKMLSRTRSGPTCLISRS